MQISNYFSSDDNSAFIPYIDRRRPVGQPLRQRDGVLRRSSPQLEAQAIRQVRAAVAKRQRFSPTDERAINMFGREQFRPMIDGITIGLQVLLGFIGTLTLGIGGVGVMNIMLVTVDERIREIGLRRALGARKSAYPHAVPLRGAGHHGGGRVAGDGAGLSGGGAGWYASDAGAAVSG